MKEVAPVDWSLPEVTLEGDTSTRVWTRLLEVYEGSGESSLFAVAPDGTFSCVLPRHSETHSPLASVDDADVPSFDFESPHAVDHFLLGRRIGEGGMAVVHEAFLPEDHAKYAVKVCRPTGSKVAAQIFATETAVMSALDHDGIVPLVASGETLVGLRWLAMPYIPGQSLRRLLNRCRRIEGLDREALLRAILLPVFLQVCDALDHAHGLGILHCDLKPGNIMVEPGGRARLLDWGMAKPFTIGKSVPGPRDLRAPGVRPVGGTPGYMAPEAIRGRVDRIGPWTDVWSLGAILYEVISGCRAFEREGADTVEFFRKVLSHEPTRPDIRVNLPPSVIDLALLSRRALSAAPAARPRSVAEMREELLTIADRLGC